MVGRSELDWCREEGVGLVAGELLETGAVGRRFEDNANCVDSELSGCVVVVGTVLADNDDEGTDDEARLLDLKHARNRCRQLSLVEGSLMLANVEIAS